MQIISVHSVFHLTEVETRSEAIKLEQAQITEKCREGHDDKMIPVAAMKVKTVDKDEDYSNFIAYKDY